MMTMMILMLADWITLAGSLPRVVALGGVSLVVGLVLAFILTVLFEPVEYDDPSGARLRGTPPGLHPSGGPRNARARN
jgi:hypothetical protein